VFEPFVVGGANGSANGATTSGAMANGRESTGLGLAVVRLIAQAHGGSARAENRPSGGARVTITIPAESGGRELGNAR
jgi:signal transduction histidine kinase